jgi:2-iminobutanoate/2-iminopropanoate deaminase
MSEFQKIETDKAPKAVGPYSQAIAAGEFVFCSGQIAIDPTTAEFIGGDIEKQTRQVIKNLEAVLSAAGSDLRHVLKSEVFLKSMNDYTIMNNTYAEYFNFDPMPARVTVEVARLPKDALVEISCIALKK